MKATKITSAEIAPLKVAALPSRPTAPTAFGGKGYSASDMKAAFDRLPLYIIDRLNLLIDDIKDAEILDDIMTGISDGHSIKELISDITSGQMASYLNVFGVSLAEAIQRLRDSILEKETGDSELRVLVDDTITSLSEMSDSVDGAIKKANEVEKMLEERLSDISLTIDDDRRAASDAIGELRLQVMENTSMLDGISTLLDEIHVYADRVSEGLLE